MFRNIQNLKKFTYEYLCIITSHPINNYASNSLKSLQISAQLQPLQNLLKADRTPFTKSTGNGPKKYNALYENTPRKHDLYTFAISELIARPQAHVHKLRIKAVRHQSAGFAVADVCKSLTVPDDKGH